MNSLILHCGAEHVTRDQLYSIPTPEPTATWRPVPHGQIADLVVNEATRRGMHLTGEDYGLNPTGSKLFGVLRFHPEGHPEHGRALGLRNSHDKSLCVGLTVGINVCVCDNLAFSGSSTVIQRKHTIRIDIDSLVPQAFDALEAQYEVLEMGIARLKAQWITEAEGRLTAVRAAMQGAIPSCDIVSVIQEFEEPRHLEFVDRNRWSLYNSFTEVAKKYTPARADLCYRRLGDVFGLR
jgi:hypothetical protein